MAVGVVERAGDLGRDPERVGDGKLLLAAQPIAERLALYKRHDVVGRAVKLARVDEAEDVRVLQVGDGLDLAQKPFGADDGGEVGAEHLDGDLAVVLEVVREVDGGHAAGAELALDPIAAARPPAVGTAARSWVPAHFTKFNRFIRATKRGSDRNGS